MLLIAVAVAIVALVPLIGGSYTELTRLRLRHMWLVAVAFGLQILIMAVFEIETPWVSPVVHVVTYALVGVFLFINRSVRWLWLIGIGWAANTLVIAINGGVMPTSEAAARQLGRSRSDSFENATVLDEPRLLFLGDVFVSPAWLPSQNAYSIGDFILFAGLVLVVWSASRRSPAATATTSPPSRSCPPPVR